MERPNPAERRPADRKQIARNSGSSSRLGSMTDEELRDLELVGNQQRLELSDYETSKQRLKEIEAEEGESQVAQPAPASESAVPQRRRPRSLPPHGRLA